MGGTAATNLQNYKMQTKHIEYALLCSQKLPYLYMSTNTCMLACSKRLHACGSCVPRIKDLTFMVCSWHSIKKNGSKGSNEHFELKKLVGLPPQLKPLAVFSCKSGHDNMSEQCNHIHRPIQKV